MLATLAAPQLAMAGDAATLDILGFSKDGKIFAFEEYGVQDGSGFPYATRFYIDTTTDAFLPGTPVRVRIDDENATIDKARAQAAESGNALVKDAELQQNRGFTAASNAITELSADPHQFVFLPRPVFPPIDDRVALRLEEIDFPTSQNCLEQGHMKGFRLIKLDPEKPGDSTMLNEDKAIPDSRGCPTGYLLGAVQTFHPRGGDPVFAVMVAVQRQGFEGPDHRWIAVTGKL
jgi:predicted secreted protein